MGAVQWAGVLTMNQRIPLPIGVNRRITWHLEGCHTKQIVKVGPGVQQVFATLNRLERYVITLCCVRVTEEAI